MAKTINVKEATINANSKNESTVVQTPTNAGMKGGISDVMIDELKMNDQAAAYAVIFGGNTSPKNWSDVKNQLKSNNIYTASKATATNTAKILTKITDISAHIGLIKTSEIGILLGIQNIDKNLKEIQNALLVKEQAGSAASKLTLELDKNSVNNFADLVKELNKAKDDDVVNKVKSIISVFQTLEGSDLNNSLKKIAESVNTLRTIDASALESSIDSMHNAITKENHLSNLINELSDADKYGKSVEAATIAITSIGTISDALSKIPEFIDDEKTKVVNSLKALVDIVNGKTSLQTVITAYALKYNQEFQTAQKTIIELIGLSEKIKEISTAFDKTSAKAVKESLKSLNSIMSADFDSNISSILTSINSLPAPGNGVSTKAIMTPIVELSDTLKKAFSTPFKDVTQNAKTLTAAINELVTILDEVQKIKSTDGFGKVSKAIFKDIKAYEKNTNEILKSQQKSIATTQAIINNARAMQDSVDDVIDESKEASRKENQIAISSMSGIILSLGAMMIIGALIKEKHPSFIKDAYAFGASLVVFTAMILLPLALITKMVDKKHQLTVDGFGGFVFALGAAMIIGGMIYERSGPKFSKNVRQFTIDLTLFVLGLSVPLALMHKAVSDALTPLLLSKLVIRCALTMMIGALFIQAQDGKLVKASLLFGAVLGLFILAVTLPLTLFVASMKQSIEGLSGISRLVTTCTLVMLLGALVVQNDKLVKSALRFGLVLGAFIFSVMLPIWIMSKSLDEDMIAIKRIGGLILESAIVLMIGGLFMTNPKLATGALEFALLLSAFITIVAIGMKFGAKSIGPGSNLFIRRLIEIVMVASLALIIGGLFMSNDELAKGALKFALLVSAFTILMCVVIGFIAKSFTKQAQKSVSLLMLTTVAFASILMIGTLFIAAFGFKNALMFTLLMAGFVMVMCVVIEYMAKKTAEIELGVKNAKQIALTVAFLSLGLLAVHIAMHYLTWEEFGLFVLSVAVVVGITILLGNEKLQQSLTIGLENALKMSGVIAALGGAFLLVHWAMSEFTLQELLLFSVSVAVMGGVFWILGKMQSSIAKGNAIALMLAAGIGLLGVAFFIVHMAMRDFTLKELLIFAASVAVMVGIFALLGIPYVAMVVGLGSLVATAMGAALITIGIGFALIAALAKMDVVGGAKALSKGIIALLDSFTLLGLLSPLLIAGAIVGTLMGVALTSLTVGFAMVGLIAMLDVEGGAKQLNNAIFIISSSFSLLGALLPVWVLGSISAAALTASIVSLSVAFALLAVVCMLDIKSASEILNSSILALSDSFLLLGSLMPIYVLGSISAATLTAALISLSLAFAALHRGARPYILSDIEIFKKALLGYEEDGKKHDGITSILEKIGNMHTIKDALQASIAANRMASALISLSVAFSILHRSINGKNLSDDINNFKKYISGEKGTDDEASLISILKKVVDAKSQINDSLKPALVLSMSVGRLVAVSRKLTKAIEESKKITADDVQTFAEVLAKTLNIFTGEKIGDIESPFTEQKLDKIRKVVKKTKKAVHPMVRVSSDLFKTVKDFATLQIPTEWNNNGVPTEYKTLKKEDFTEAADSLTSVLLALVNGFMEADKNAFFKGIVDDFKTGDVSSILQKLIRGGGSSRFSAIFKTTKGITEVVSGVSQAVSGIAKLMVADEWNKDGKPIHYHQLIDGDFEKAADNIVLILNTMISGISAFGLKYAKLIKDFANGDYEDSIIGQTIIFSKGVGEIISNIAESVSAYAQLMIPDQWNKEGKPNHFRPIDNGDFIEMNKNVKTILTSVIESIYEASKTEAFKKLKTKTIEEIIPVISTAAKMLSDVARTIVDYSSLRIPVFASNKLEPTGYRNINPTDFTNMATNVGSILTSLPQALADGWKAMNDTGVSIEMLNTMTETYTPMAKMLSSLAKVMKDYASMKKLPIMDKDGKIVSYIEIDLDKDLASMGDNVQKILTGMATAVRDAYNIFIQNGAVKSGEVSKMIKAVKPITDVLSGLIGSVQAYAELRIPKYDNKGNIAGYITLANGQKTFNQLFIDIKNNLTNILNGLFGAVSEVIETNSWLNDAKSPKNAAITNFANKLDTVLSPVTQTIDLVKKYSELKFPKGFTTDGKVTGYDTIKEFEFGTFQLTLTQLISAIPKAVYWAIHDTKEKMDALTGDAKDNTVMSLDDFTAKFTEITEFISKTVLPTVQSIIELKIPIGYDKEGKPNKFYSFDKKSLGDLTNTIADIICAIPNAMHKAVQETNNEFTPNDKDLLDATMKLVQNTFTEVLGKLYSNEEIENIMNIIKSGNTFIDAIDILSNITEYGKAYTLHTIDNINETFIAIQNTFGENGSFSKSVRDSIINDSASSIADFYSLLNTFTSVSIKNGSLKELSVVELAKYKNKTASFAKIAKELCEASTSLTSIYSNLSQIESADAGENAKTMLFDINEASGHIENSNIKKLKGEADALDKFVISINKVDLRRTSALTNMFGTMNRFSSSIKDLNKFTTVLATKIATVLDELRTEMNRASETISNADNLRKEREKKMEKTLEKINKIMNQTLNVNVSSNSGESISGSQTFSEIIN